jgi:hypothetical protein
MIIYKKSITTTVENGVLIISCDYNSFINIKKKKLRLKCLLLNPCALLVLHRLQVQIQLRVKTLTWEHLSASNINLNIESDYIECASSGITIKGMALNMEATASSGSDWRKGLTC